MKLLFVICDRNLTRKVRKTLKEENIDHHMSFYGKGTADSGILSYLGLKETEKEVILTVIESKKTSDILARLGAYDFIKNQGAVAFTVPIDGISKHALKLFRTGEETK